MRSFLVVAAAVAVALAGCVEQGNQEDSDGDGLPDSFETKERGICVQGLDGQICRAVTSDPEKKDTDGDGVSDQDEVGLGTNPRDVDSDGDGLLDGRDILKANAGDLEATFVAKGIAHTPDRWLGEKDACDGIGTNPAKADSDRPYSDGLPDGAEIMGWNVTVRGETRKVASHPCSTDTDNDGLRDGDEKTLGTDPTVADTDGDGSKDGVDVDPLADLGVKLTVTKIKRGLTGGSTRFEFFAGPTQATETRAIPPGGNEVSLNLVFLGNTDDTSGSRESLDVDILLGVKDGQTGSALDFGAVPLAIKYDVVKGTIKAAARTGTGSITLTGADGSITLTIETTKS